LVQFEEGALSTLFMSVSTVLSFVLDFSKTEDKGAETADSFTLSCLSGEQAANKTATDNKKNWDVLFLIILYFQ
jgi:hypothetical protein